LTLLFSVKGIVAGSSSQVPVNTSSRLDAMALLDCVFANFATALAEAAGRRQAESLPARPRYAARRLRRMAPLRISSAALRMGDRVVVETGQVIPGGR